MVHWHTGDPEGVGIGDSAHGPCEQRPNKPGACGIGDRAKLRLTGMSLLKREPYKRHHASYVIAACEFRHHSAVFGVHGYLSVQHVRHQS